MSTCSVIVQSSSEDPALQVGKSEEEDILATTGQQPKDNNIDGKDDNENTKKKRITYTKEELLELRSAPASLRRPDCLYEEFFKNGVWDIEAWHKSSTSRSSSPAVDGKCVTFDSGKKIELLDNAIELAPHRRSFCQGCHVQSTPETECKEKDSPLKRLGGKGGFGSDAKSSFYEGKDRLTARASLRRRTIEKTVLRENKSDPDVKRLSKSGYDDGLDRAMNDRKTRGKEIDKENRGDERNLRRDRTNRRRTDSYDSLPEWMTDGPSSQLETIELKGFNKEIEDERSAMRKEAKQRPGNKLQPQPSRKSTKGGSRSSTPTEKKESTSNRTDRKDREDSGVKKNEKNNDNSRQNTPTEKIFDENAYFDVMDYLPPHLFADDYTNETNSQSKFSQWFRSLSASSNDGSRPSSVPLSFEATAVPGYSLESPTMPLQQYFTPIQPAPTTQQYEDPIAISPLMELFPKRKSPTVEGSKEVKGRMTLKDIEPEMPKPIGQKPDNTNVPQDSTKNDLTAFDKLVSSMKAAGQLPEKPAPVVSGLPEHLLPKPPKRTSPSFEKLKRALSRSPSPVAMGRMSPLSFVNRPVSPLVGPIGERLLSPEFFRQPQHHRSMSPGSLFGNFHDGVGTQKGSQGPSQYQQDINERRFISNQQRANSSSNEGLIQPESHRGSKHQGNAKIPAAFLPTSVIKKMHSEKQDMRDRQDMYDDALAVKLNFAPASHSPFDVSHAPPHRNKDAMHEHDTKINNDNFGDAAEHSFSSQSLFEGMLNGKLASTERHQNSDFAQRLKLENSSNTVDIDRKVHMSRSIHSSAPLQRDISPAGIHPTQSSSRVVGSGSLFSRGHSDLEAGQKSFFDLASDKCLPAESQQQLNVSRPPVLSGFTRPTAGATVGDNRIDSMDIGARGGVMQSKGPIGQLPNGHQNQIINQQQQLPRAGQFRQRPAPQQAPVNQFSHGRNIQQNNPRLPVPMNPPASHNSMPFYRTNIPAATAAMAAQFVQQQLFQQAARAHLHAAQMLQQQQQQNLFRTQVQAAMAQAYARGQAAKAIMSNPRAVANNLQAVAQQMGLRAPQPGQGGGKPFRMPLVSQPKTDEVKEPCVSPESTLQESPLSKWFNVDAIKKSPPAPTNDPAAKGKVISVEDLERSQK